MAVELHVLFSGKLPSKAALTRAMKELGFPVSIPAGGGALEKHSGFLPMKLRGQRSGVEFAVRNDRADIEEIAGEDFGARFERCASFRWGGDEGEMLCALCTAAALAKLVDGVVLDEEGSLSVEQAIEQARGNLDSVKPPDPRYGTRPADIRPRMVTTAPFAFGSITPSALPSAASGISLRPSTAAPSSRRL